MPTRTSMSRSRISIRYSPSRNCRLNDCGLAPSTRSSVENSTRGSVSKVPEHAERQSTQMAQKPETSRDRRFFLVAATPADTHILVGSPCDRRQCLQAHALHRNQE